MKFARSSLIVLAFATVALAQAPGSAQALVQDAKSRIKEITLEQLKELGAENVQEIHMGVEEIVVQILKGGRNVEIIQG